MEKIVNTRRFKILRNQRSGDRRRCTEQPKLCVFAFAFQIPEICAVWSVCAAAKRVAARKIRKDEHTHKLATSYDLQQHPKNLACCSFSFAFQTVKDCTSFCQQFHSIIINYALFLFPKCPMLLQSFPRSFHQYLATQFISWLLGKRLKMFGGLGLDRFGIVWHHLASFRARLPRLGASCYVPDYSSDTF